MTQVEPLTRSNPMNATTELDLTPAQALGVALSVAVPDMVMGDAQEKAPAMLAHIEAMGFALAARQATVPVPLDVETFGDAIMAALRLRLIHGATDATYMPREVAEMVGHVIEKQCAAALRSKGEGSGEGT